MSWDFKHFTVRWKIIANVLLFYTLNRSLKFISIKLTFLNLHNFISNINVFPNADGLTGEWNSFFKSSTNIFITKYMFTKLITICIPMMWRRFGHYELNWIYEFQAIQKYSRRQQWKYMKSMWPLQIH